MEVLVALSGGVDSSVAAALLLDAGHHVTAVTMKLWGGDGDRGCCSVSDVDDARRVADHLGIEHHVFNFGDDFDAYVVEPYVQAYAEGLTPNPCIECNRHLKFDRLLRRADALGFDAVATGHHARVVTTAAGTRRIARGVDAAKDQSYVLHMLGQDVLRRLRLPVGELTKDEVRARAAALGLRTASKPDSQDVCFISGPAGRERFLAGRVPLHPARVVDTSGGEVGHVTAVELLTVGQRKGLDLAGGSGRRYVVDVDVDARTVVVGDRDALLVPGLDVDDVVWADGDMPAGPCLVQVSAHGRALPAHVAPAPDGTAGSARVTWTEPQRRVAPGQAVVLYAGDEVLGGGTARRAASAVA
jgi:tRNA-specific 2-thiouridylase